MTADQAGPVCIDAYMAEFADGETPTGEPRVYERQVDPKWLVLVPIETPNGPAMINCYVGGSVEAPVFGLVGGALSDYWSDEQIVAARESNGGF